MYIIGTEKRYLELYNELENFVVVDILDLILERVQVFDESYGAERNLEEDLGGYCAVFPTAADWKEEYQKVLDKYRMDKELYEYQEQIDCGAETWIEELFILSSDYAVIMIYPEVAEGGQEVC